MLGTAALDFSRVRLAIRGGIIYRKYRLYIADIGIVSAL